MDACVKLNVFYLPSFYIVLQSTVCFHHYSLYLYIDYVSHFMSKNSESH